jgi:TonB family protein
MKPFHILIFLAIFLLHCTCSAQDSIFTYTEQLPEFSGDYNIYKLTHLKYPAEALKAGIEGRCTVKFIVDANGVVNKPVITKGANPILDAEAIRFVGEMPKWKPAKQNGQAVNCYQTLPISFQIKDTGITLNSSKNFQVIAQPPGDWQEYLRRNLTQPFPSKSYNYGTVYAKFIVYENGAIDSIKLTPYNIPVFQSQEIIRVLKQMKGWKPAFQNGVYVKDNFTLPISFNW